MVAVEPYYFSTHASLHASLDVASLKALSAAGSQRAYSLWQLRA